MNKQIIVIIFLSLLSCSSNKADLTLAHAAFYKTPAEIIASYGKSDDYKAHYVTALAYNKKKDLPRALFHFANSAFATHRVKKFSHYPSPVYNFISGFHVKSPYFEDAVFHIASIYYSYREHKYVLKFIDHISKDKSGLYLKAILLRSKSLSALNKNNAAEKNLLSAKKYFTDYSSVSRINIRLASLYNKEKKYAASLGLYLETLKLKEKTWQANLCVKKIISLSETGKITVDKKNYKALAIGLYHAKKYKDAFFYVKKLPEHQLETQKFHIKTLVRLRKTSQAEKIIDSKNKADNIYIQLLESYADELWDTRRKTKAISVYKKILNSGLEPQKKEALKKIALYYEDRRRGNYKEYLKKYIENYKTDSSSPYLIWLLGRNELRDGRKVQAIENFRKGIARFPQSTYTARSRFWLYRLSPDAKEKEKILRDCAVFHPDSFYTWRLFTTVVSKKSLSALQKNFDKSLQAHDRRGMILYNMLLLIKEKKIESSIKRIARMPEAVTKKYRDYDDMVNSMKITHFEDSLNRLDRYFQAGELTAVSAELRLLEYDSKENGKAKSVYAALAHYGAKYKYYFYSTYFYMKLLQQDKVDINISLMSEKTLHNIFPRPFKNCMDKYAKKYKVDQNRLYAMMKAESLFHHTAVSSAGAMGLMQIMPNTAKGIARNLKLRTYNLANPCTSIRFSAHYMGWLKRLFNGNNLYMTAGYNGGPGNVMKWKKKLNTKDRDYFTEFIPFLETRFYVFKIEKYMKQYEIIY